MIRHNSSTNDNSAYSYIPNLITDKIITRVISNKKYALGILICLSLATIESILYPVFSFAGLFIFPIYILLLLAMTLSPFHASTALCMLGIACFMLPMKIECPTWYWGVWVALGSMSPACGSVIPAVMFSITESLISLTSNIMFGMSIPSATTMAATFPIAAMVGVYFLEHKKLLLLHSQREHARERIEQQKQILDTMRFLHDEIAGDITYAIQLNRQNMLNRTYKGTIQHDYSSEIEHVLSFVLQSIREASTHPQRWNRDLNNNNYQSSKSARFHLLQLLHEQQQRLMYLGYYGNVAITGTPTLLDNQTINSISALSNEILNNIISHGTPGPYSFNIIISAKQNIQIISTNHCNHHEKINNNSCLGLKLIAETIDSMHGNMRTSIQNHEWLISIIIPIQ